MKVQRDIDARIPPTRFLRVFHGVWRLHGAALLAISLVLGCAHGGKHQIARLSAPARVLDEQVAALPKPRFEEEYAHARALFESLPLHAPARDGMRQMLTAYLLDPLSRLGKPGSQAVSLVGNDETQQILKSFRDAASLYAPHDIQEVSNWAPDEVDRLRAAAQTVRSIFARRGDAEATALALAVLAQLTPDDPAERKVLQDELDALMSWSKDGRHLAAGTANLQGPPSVRKILESVSLSWASPENLQRLTTAHLVRQRQMASLLRRPSGRPLRPSQPEMFGEFLSQDSEKLPPVGFGIAAAHARAGALSEGYEALTRLKGHPGDAPHLRAYFRPFASPSLPDAADYLALARSFLPEVPLLGGYAKDNFDARAALQVLRTGALHHPNNSELLILAARVSRIANQPYLALRYLQEAEALFQTKSDKPEQFFTNGQELYELSVLLLRAYTDPEDVNPIERAAQKLRARMEGARETYARNVEWLNVDPIDLTLAQAYMDAGLINKAEPLFASAIKQPNVQVEELLQFAALLSKSGQPERSALALRKVLENPDPEQANKPTIGFVRNQARLATSLSKAYRADAQPEPAEKAVKIAARLWERLFVEHVRGRNGTAAAEAIIELGQLDYELGNRTEALQKFAKAISIAESRDQSYIDSIAFLVQRGEVQAALDIFRLALSQPDSVVSEYVKVYISLWIQDITRRQTGSPDSAAQAYLGRIANRTNPLRPLRAATWYTPLCRFAIGELSFDELKAKATTPGRRAELLFYQAMRRLSEGDETEAARLWSEVLQTNMVSFFEFEMARAYLKGGAPAHPPLRSQKAKTI